MAKKRMITVSDSNYRRGMNSLDDPKALADGECVSLVNAFPGYPLRPRKGSDFTSILGGVTLESKSFYMSAKMRDGRIRQWAFFWVKSVGGNYSLRYLNIDQPSMQGEVAGISYYSTEIISARRFDFQAIDGILYALVNFAPPGTYSGGASVMYAIEAEGADHFVAREIPPSSDNNYGVSVGYWLSGSGGGSPTFTGPILFGYSFTLVRRSNTYSASNVYVPGEIESPEDPKTRFMVLDSIEGSSIEITLLADSGYGAFSQYGFTHIRFYRTRNLIGAYDGSGPDAAKSLADGADRYFLMDVPIPSTGGNTAERDRVSVGEHLGEMNQLSASGYTMPPQIGRNMLYFKDRLFMGTDDGKVFFSEIPGGDGGSDAGFAQTNKGKYALWFKPLDYRLDLDVEEGIPIIGLVSLGDDLYIFKRNKIYVVVGGEPTAAPWRVIFDNAGCLYPDAITKCIVAGQEALFFLSSAGPMLITSGGYVKPFSEFKVRDLWPEAGSGWIEAESCSASFWNSALWLFFETETGERKVFGYLSAGEDNGAFEMTHYYSALLGQLMVTTDGRALSVCEIYGYVFIVDFLGRGVSVDSYSGAVGGTFPITITLRSRKIYPGPEERSVSELFRLVAYCEYTNRSAPFRVEVTSNRRRQSTDFLSDTVFQSAYPNSADTVRRSVDFTVKADFIGEYFQYQMTKSFNGSGTFDFYGVEIQCLPRPQLGRESLATGGALQDTWR